MVITEDERKKLLAELFKLSRPVQVVINKLLNDYDKHKSFENLSVEDLPGEIWVDIEGYGGFYQISNKTRVKSFYKGKIRILRQGFNTNGYPTVSLHKNGKAKTYTVHRLVAKAFIPNPENKPKIDHIDTNRSNASVENLRWVTSSENSQAAIKNGTQKIGTESPLAKLAENDIKCIRENYKPYDRTYGIRAMAKHFGVSISTVADVVNHRNYKNVD